MTIAMTTDCLTALILTIGLLFILCAERVEFLYSSSSTVITTQHNLKSIAKHFSRRNWFAFFISLRNNQLTVRKCDATQKNVFANPDSRKLNFCS